MARFDVYRLPGRRTLMVVDVQADLLSDLMSRVVVPLEPKSAARPERLPRLEPEFRIAGKEYVFKPTDIAVLPATLLSEPVTNLEANYHLEIVAALDFLFQGF